MTEKREGESKKRELNDKRKLGGDHGEILLLYIRGLFEERSLAENTESLVCERCSRN